MSASTVASARIQVIGLAELADVATWREGPTLVVVDATGGGPSSLVTLARLVRLRRLLRARGGDLVVATDADTATALQRSGLCWTLPFRRTVPAAVEAAESCAGG